MLFEMNVMQNYAFWQICQNLLQQKGNSIYEFGGKFEELTAEHQKKAKPEMAKNGMPPIRQEVIELFCQQKSHV